MHNPRLDRDKLDLLHAAVGDAGRTIARSVDRIEKTQDILTWLRRLDSPRLGFTPPEGE